MKASIKPNISERLSCQLSSSLTSIAPPVSTSCKRKKIERENWGGYSVSFRATQYNINSIILISTDIGQILPICRILPILMTDIHIINNKN